MMKFVLAACTGVVLQCSLMTATALAAETINLHVISAQPPRMLTVGMLSEFMLPEINERLAERGSEYQVEWRESYAGVVAGSTETFTAIQHGVGDMGQVGTLFEPAKLPLAQMTFFVPFTGANVATVLEVMADLHERIPELDAFFERYNQVLLSLMGTDSYYLMTKFPVDSVEDLDGRKLGLPGSAANWVKGTGAIPVNSTISEYYNSLKTGVYDGVIVFASAMVPFKLYEVAPYITQIDIGAMQSGAITINKEVWEGLPQEVRDVMAEVGDEYRQRLAEEAVSEAESAVAKAAELGAIVSVLPEEERTRWAETMPNIAEEWAETLEARGLPAKELVTLYLDALRNRGADIARDWDAGWTVERSMETGEK